MKHAWQVWLVAGLCGGLVVAAMGGLTWYAVQADLQRNAAVAAADLEQRVNLALWRMDTKLAPLIAEESARPLHFYQTALPSAASDGRAEGRLVASPLLSLDDPSVVLNFTCSTNGQWQSPQAPPRELAPFASGLGLTDEQIAQNWQRLQELASRVTFDDLIRLLPLDAEQPSSGAAGESGLVAGRASAADPADNVRYYGNYIAVDNERLDRPATDGAPVPAPGNTSGLRSRPNSQEDFFERQAVEDFNERGSRVQRQVGLEAAKQQRELAPEALVEGSEPSQDKSVVQSIARAMWVDDQLLLARRVVQDDATVVHGSWLNWPRIKTSLLAETAEILPQADLVPVRPGERADPTRMLAGLPVRLVVAAPKFLAATSSPLRWSLGAGWTALLLALAAGGALLWGVVALSERRATFVSAVTHELRTPLTTFLMYSELLDRDMAPTPQRQREYIRTLYTEAQRLGRLVENVLAYARLERGRRPQRAEHTTPAELIDRMAPRLAERLAAADMTLCCDVASEAAAAALRTDGAAVEQILFNLVDNAAKYAAAAEDRRVHLAVTLDGAAACFTVRDHGPGFASRRTVRRSQPFSKSAETAAESAPGVGLGLALCRRLARELGGELSSPASGPHGQPGGAVVVLKLPVEPRRGGVS